MESWVVFGIQVALSLTAAVAALVAMRWARLAARNGDATSKLMEELLALLRKGHGYSDPSAAAVVLPSPKPAEAPAPPPLPEPEPASRPAFPVQPLPSPALQEIARSALTRAALRGQLSDESTLPSEGTSDEEIKAAIHAKHEREADERSARRAMLPAPVEAPPVEQPVEAPPVAAPAPVAVEPAATERASRPSDEPTQVYKGADRDKMLRGVKMRALPSGATPPPRPRPLKGERLTLVDRGVPTVPKAPRAPKVDPLAGVPTVRPVSSAKRAAATWAVHASAGILAVFQARLAASRAARVDVDHCGGPDCNNDPDGVCSCDCAPCDRRRAHFTFAATEARNPKR